VLANHDGRFTPGLFARVRLVGSDHFRALLVDDRAILTDQDRKFVYIVDEDRPGDAPRYPSGAWSTGCASSRTGFRPASG
jgi:membrane fusion protein, multidrug efflux system